MRSNRPATTGSSRSTRLPPPGPPRSPRRPGGLRCAARPAARRPGRSPPGPRSRAGDSPLTAGAEGVLSGSDCLEVLARSRPRRSRARQPRRACGRGTRVLARPGCASRRRPRSPRGPAGRSSPARGCCARGRAARRAGRSAAAPARRAASAQRVTGSAPAGSRAVGVGLVDDDTVAQEDHPVRPGRVPGLVGDQHAGRAGVAARAQQRAARPRRSGSRARRWARRPGPGGARRPGRGRWRRAAAGRRTSRRGSGRRGRRSRPRQRGERAARAAAGAAGRRARAAGRRSRPRSAPGSG